MSLLRFFSNLLNNPNPENIQTAQIKPAPDDGYLSCSTYHNRPITIEEHQIAVFKAGDYKYFVVYDEEGSVYLRSQGFDNDEALEYELSAAIRLKDVGSAYTLYEFGDKALYVLKDENGQEVGRSCLE